MYLTMKMKHHTYLTSTQYFEKHVDLLKLSNSVNSHYVLMKDFNRFMTNETKHFGKKYFLSILFTMLL